MSQGKIVGDRYKLGRKVGEGTSGSVFEAELCEHDGRTIPNTKKYAIKALPMSVVQQNLDQTKREIAILKDLRFKYVVSLREVLQSANHVYIVMELVQGGTLANLPLPLPESTARDVLRQLLEGLQYVHSRGVAHRDLKPANVMVKRYAVVPPTANGQQAVQQFCVKLTDFGLANIQKEQSLLTTRCGTPHYVAPEIVDGHKYDGRASDVWSCGVLLYYILTGRVPFDDSGLALAQPNFDGLWNKIRTATFVMPPNFSPGVQRLLLSMLCVDPGQRATVDDCLNDPWVTPPAPPVVVDQSLAASVSSSSVGGGGCGLSSTGGGSTAAGTGANTPLTTATNPGSPLMMMMMSPSSAAHSPTAAGASPPPVVFTGAGIPTRMTALVESDDQDRRHSEQEEILGGDAFIKVGTERMAVISNENSPTAGADGGTSAEGDQALDAFSLYLALRPRRFCGPTASGDPPAADDAIKAGMTGRVCLYFRVGGGRGGRTDTKDCGGCSSFADLVQVVTSRLHAAHVEVRGGAGGAVTSPPSSPIKGGSGGDRSAVGGGSPAAVGAPPSGAVTGGRIVVGKSTATFTGTVNPFKVATDLKPKGVVFLYFCVTAIDGLSSVGRRLGGGPEACLIGVSRVDQSKSAEDFSTAIAMIAAKLKE